MDSTHGYLSKWDVSSVTRTDSMFSLMSSFTGDLSQ